MTVLISGFFFLPLINLPKYIQFNYNLNLQIYTNSAQRSFLKICLGRRIFFCKPKKSKNLFLEALGPVIHLQTVFQSAWGPVKGSRNLLKGSFCTHINYNCAYLASAEQKTAYVLSKGLG